MQYIHYNYELGLIHQLRTENMQGAFLDFSPDAELGGEPFTTFAFVFPVAHASGQYASVLKRLVIPVSQLRIM